MNNEQNFQNSMRAVTINCKSTLWGLIRSNVWSSDPLSLDIEGYGSQHQLQQVFTKKRDTLCTHIASENGKSAIILLYKRPSLAVRNLAVYMAIHIFSSMIVYITPGRSRLISHHAPKSSLNLSRFGKCQSALAPRILQHMLPNEPVSWLSCGLGTGHMKTGSNSHSP